MFSFLRTTLLNLAIVGVALYGFNYTTELWNNARKDITYSSSVEIGRISANGEFDGFCSGTIVHAVTDEVTKEVTQHVLTAKHCFLSTPKQFPSTPKQTVYSIQASTKDKMCPEPAKLIKLSDKSDLALLEVKSKNVCNAQVSPVAKRGTEVNFGDQVFVLGYPYGASKTLTFGRIGYLESVQGFKDVSKSTRFQKATPQIGPGTSGGGLFNASGNVVGVTTGGLGNAISIIGFINYFTPLDEVQNFVEEFKWK